MRHEADNGVLEKLRTFSYKTPRVVAVTASSRQWALQGDLSVSWKLVVRGDEFSRTGHEREASRILREHFVEYSGSSSVNRCRANHEVALRHRNSRLQCCFMHTNHPQLEDKTGSNGVVLKMHHRTLYNGTTNVAKKMDARSIRLTHSGRRHIRGPAAGG